MSTHRFTFPGFTSIRQADTSTHEVEVGSITVGDDVFVVHMIRKAGLPFEVNFLVAKVFDRTESVRIWEFPKSSFHGLGLLAKAGGETVIALVGKGRSGKIEYVIPFSTFPYHQPSTLRRRIELKQLAGKYLARAYNLTSGERAFARRDYERRREAEYAERARQKEILQRARIALVKRILVRGKVEAYTTDGRKRFGLPVVENEWPSLSHDTYVVLVESYDDETGEMGEPIEAFRVVKERGKNPEKGFSASVMWHPTKDTAKADAPAIPDPVGEMVIEVDEDAFEVAVYATMDEIRTARAGGLNSGSYVTARDKRDGDRYEVFSVHKDGIETIGRFAPLA